MKQSLKQSLVIASFSAVRLVASSVMQAYIFAVMGIGFQTDALISSALLPQLLTTLMVNALMQVLVPIFAADRKTEQQRDAWAMFVVLLGVFALLVLALVITADMWTAWLVPGFSPEAKSLTVALTRIQLVGMVFAAPFAVLWSLHCAREKLIRAEAALAVSSLVSFVALVLTLPRFGVQAAAAVAALRALLDFVLLANILGPWLGARLDRAFVRLVWQRLKYLLAGSAYYGTEPLVNQVLVSFAPVGGLSTLSLGQQLFNVSSQIVNKAFAAPLVPALSVAAREGRWHDFQRAYRQRLWVVVGLAVAALVAIFMLGNPLIELLMGRISMTAESLHALWHVLLALFGMCLGGLAGQMTMSALLAMGDARTVTRLGIITYTVYIPLKVLAFQWGGLIGLALASSLFYLVNMIGQHYFVERAIVQATQGKLIPHPQPLPFREGRV